MLAPNTADALERLRDAGLLDAASVATLTEALGLWRNVQGVLRLSVGERFDESTVPEGSRAFVAAVCGRDSFEALKDEIADRAASCHAIFRRLVEEPARDLPPAG